jgi:tetratricopeptide (TPR) repeat protein
VDGDGPLDGRDIDELTKLSQDAEEDGAFERMLACADEALRVDEREPVAAHLRAAALAHLERLDDAKDAFVMALALAPQDPYVLAGISDLYANLLPQNRQRSLAALAFAERGLGHASADPELARRLRLLAAWSSADLGEFGASLQHGRAALALDPEDDEAAVTVGRALFELTRFDEARSVLEPLAGKEPRDAEGLYWLGLSLERIEGQARVAARYLREASLLDPQRYPPPVDADDALVQRLVAEEIAALPSREGNLLRQSLVPVLVRPLPELEDLRAEEPPLSPTAVGMLRGPPLGLEVEARREILLFSRNLARTARDVAGLREQIRITLLHELGHLVGEDEADLRARGLE